MNIIFVPNPKIKRIIFLFYKILKLNRFLCPMTSYMIIYDIIFMMTLHNMYLSSKTETTRSGVRKMKISSNPYNFITKMFLVIKSRK